MAENFILRWNTGQNKWALLEIGFAHHQVLQLYDTKKDALNDVEKLAHRDNELKLVDVENKKGVQTRTEKFRPETG